MAQKDLIPLTKRSPEEAFAIRSKGGATKTQQKVWAQKLVWIKKRMKTGQLKDGDEEFLLERATNDKASGLALLNYFDEIKESVHPSQRVALLNAMNAIHKTIHGERVKNENVNINVDMNQLIQQAYEERKREEEERKGNKEVTSDD